VRCAFLLVLLAVSCAHAANDAFQECIAREHHAELCESERGAAARETAQNQRTRMAVAAGLSAMGGGMQGTAAPAAGGALLVFGGSGHQQFLGCLTCSEYASDSIRNEYGRYGSSYSSTSITNEYSEYGSPYSSTSACNEYASDPPVVVDPSGRYYGRLTLNEYRDQVRLDGIAAWLAAICKH
jgi:hypothetical protein